MRLRLLIVILFFHGYTAFSQDLNPAAGRAVGRMLEYSWAKETVDSQGAYTAIFQVDKTNASVLLLIGEEDQNDSLSVRYWMLPKADSGRALVDCLDKGLENRFAGYPSGLFRFSRLKTPLLKGGLRQKFDITIRQSHKGGELPVAWVAFGGEGMTMTVHSEHANSEVGRMVSMLVNEARRDYGKSQHWYRRIHPLVWSSIFALLACAGVVGITVRKRQMASGA